MTSQLLVGANYQLLILWYLSRQCGEEKGTMFRSKRHLLQYLSPPEVQRSHFIFLVSFCVPRFTIPSLPFLAANSVHTSLCGLLLKGKEVDSACLYLCTQKCVGVEGEAALF